MNRNQLDGFSALILVRKGGGATAGLALIGDNKIAVIERDVNFASEQIDNAFKLGGMR